MALGSTEMWSHDITWRDIISANPNLDVKEMFFKRFLGTLLSTERLWVVDGVNLRNQGMIQWLGIWKVKRFMGVEALHPPTQNTSLRHWYVMPCHLALFLLLLLIHFAWKYPKTDYIVATFIWYRYWYFHGSSIETDTGTSSHGIGALVLVLPIEYQ